MADTFNPLGLLKYNHLFSPETGTVVPSMARSDWKAFRRGFCKHDFASHGDDMRWTQNDKMRQITTIPNSVGLCPIVWNRVCLTRLGMTAAHIVIENNLLSTKTLWCRTKIWDLDNVFTLKTLFLSMADCGNVQKGCCYLSRIGPRIALHTLFPDALCWLYLID